MTDDANLHFDDAIEVPDPVDRVQRSPSTPQTKARYQALKARRPGETWQEGSRIYRKGPHGITVYDFRRGY
jgi:hypothetical protein